MVEQWLHGLIGVWWWVRFDVTPRPGIFAKAASSPLGKSHASVSARATDMFEFKKLLGYVWPVNVYVQEKGRQPPRKSVKSFQISAGQKVRGVLMPKTAGEPVGSIALHQIRQTASELEVEVANSERNTAAEVQDAWDKAQKRNKCQLRTPEKAEPGEHQEEALQLRIPKFRAGDDDSSGDDAIFAAVWGRRISSKLGKSTDDLDVDSATLACWPQRIQIGHRHP